jgi:hypothetical protein
MKPMIALVVAGLFLGLGALADVQTDTYVFTEDPDSGTAFNGSTITIDGTGAGVTAYSFMDTDISPTPFTSAVGIENNSVTSYGTTGWSGDFNFYASDGSFEVIFDATGTSMDGTLLGAAVDPPGTWALVGAPDASSTFPLMLGVLGILAGAYRCNRPRVAALA